MKLEIKCTQITMTEDFTTIGFATNGSDISFRIPNPTSIDFAPGDKVVATLELHKENWS